MAYFEAPTPVKIDQLDLGDIQKTNIKNALYQQSLQDAQYQTASQNALNDFLKANPNATGQNVLADMASKGFGEAGQKYAYNWANRQHATLQYEADLRKEISNIVGSVTDEASKTQAIDYMQSKFPDSDFSQYRSMPWQDAVKQANNFGLGAAGRVDIQRKDAGNAAAGVAPGVDMSTLNTASSMRNAADANDRAKTLFPGQVEQQGATLEHTNLSNDAMRQSMESEQKVLVGPGGIRMRPDDAYAAFQKGAFMNPDMTFTDFLQKGQFKVGSYNPKTKALTVDEGQPFGSDGATPPQSGGQSTGGGAPQGGGQPSPSAGFGSGQGFGGAAAQPGNAAPVVPQAAAGQAMPPAQSPAGQKGAYVQAGNGQKLTPEIAAQYAKLAGGNRSKAEYLAKYDGWSW